ncbi:sigma-70 family RNA polymerase sigma factor [Hyphomonadaceae bacterium ML37]|nr:sigma-70 family RNA polymerase sigma factor [Hyphomonadaceae bacterium ML37]
MTHDTAVSVEPRALVHAPQPAACQAGTHPFHDQLRIETPELRRHAIRLTRDWHRAQDLVQETLTKAWANRARYTPGTNLRAWLHTILRNTFLSDVRKRRREVEDADGHLTARLSQPPSQDHAVALSQLMTAMTALPESQRQALTLVGATGFSQEEAAIRLGCAIGTIKSRVSRARASLGALLPPHMAPRRAR